jgi:hypothetical protein
MMRSVSISVAAEEIAVEGFLILSGALAMTVGLLAIIEGHLHCLGGILRRKKGQP